MIADLAVMHPDKHEYLQKEGEDAVIFWIHEMPSPHANGLRALAAMGSTKDITAFRKWADPAKPLPLEGQQPPFPEEWVIAQSAMRYVGWLKDEQSWGVLERSLTRRDPKLDVTMDGLMAGGLAILGHEPPRPGRRRGRRHGAVAKPQGLQAAAQVHRGTQRERAEPLVGLRGPALGRVQRGHARGREEGAGVQQARQGRLPAPRLPARGLHPPAHPRHGRRALADAEPRSVPRNAPPGRRRGRQDGLRQRRRTEAVRDDEVRIAGHGRGARADPRRLHRHGQARRGDLLRPTQGHHRGAAKPLVRRFRLLVPRRFRAAGASSSGWTTPSASSR